MSSHDQFNFLFHSFLKNVYFDYLSGHARSFFFPMPGLFFFLMVACGIFDLHCSAQNLQLWHVGSSSLTRDRTWPSALGGHS